MVDSQIMARNCQEMAQNCHKMGPKCWKTLIAYFARFFLIICLGIVWLWVDTGEYIFMAVI